MLPNSEAHAPLPTLLRYVTRSRNAFIMFARADADHWVTFTILRFLPGHSRALFDCVLTPGIKVTREATKDRYCQLPVEGHVACTRLTTLLSAHFWGQKERKHAFIKRHSNSGRRENSFGAVFKTDSGQFRLSQCVVRSGFGCPGISGLVHLP